MTAKTSPAEDFVGACLVPEVLVGDLPESLRFWRDLCGFAVVFDRLD
jgi:hypothetical protein